MQLNVIKRDGSKESFKVSKLKIAVENCCKSNDCPTAETNSYLKSFMDRFPFENEEEIEVERIQDWVISDLKEHLSEEIAISYSEHREFHSKVRDAKYNKKFYDTIFDITQGSRGLTNRENANKDASQSYVIRDLIAGETSKKLYRELVMPEKIKKLHDKGVIHVHDTDYRILTSLTNCCLVDLEDILQNGTVINGKKIITPNSLKTASTIVTQVVAAIASSQYGGLSISLSHLAPFIEKSRQRYIKLLESTISGDNLTAAVEKLVSKEIEDSMQTMVYQLNTLYTSSGQSPFVTIWLYVNEYPEYEKETALLIEEMLKQRIKGMASPSGHQINPTFPKLIYCLSEKNIDPDSEYFYLTQLAAECTSKRMVPDYVSEKVMREIKDGDVFPLMGCRAALTPYKDPDTGLHKHYGRLNLGVISLNIPYVALESKDEEDFFKRLDKYARVICDEQMRIAEDIAASPTSRSPIMWNHGAISRLPEDALIGDLIKKKKGYSTITLGYVGIAEAVYRFGTEYVSDEGHRMAVRILETLNNVTNEYKAQSPYDFSVYGTPSESLTTKFASALKRFKKIPNVNDRTYITNSYHVPVTYEIDCFDKLKFESDLQRLSTGGAISYVEMPDISKNPEAVYDVMKYIYDNIMYAEINTTGCDVCYNCGYHGEIHLNNDYTVECPNCGTKDTSKMYVCRRMCGYLGNIVSGTTKGRFDDINDRVKHA